MLYKIFSKAMQNMIPCVGFSGVAKPYKVDDVKEYISVIGGPDSDYFLCICKMKDGNYLSVKKLEQCFIDMHAGRDYACWVASSRKQMFDMGLSDEDRERM